MPSTRGLYTQISRHGTGAGRAGINELLILNASASTAAGAKALVLRIASTSERSRRKIRSSSIERTLASDSSNRSRSLATSDSRFGQDEYCAAVNSAIRVR